MIFFLFVIILAKNALTKFPGIAFAMLFHIKSNEYFFGNTFVADNVNILYKCVLRQYSSKKALRKLYPVFIIQKRYSIDGCGWGCDNAMPISWDCFLNTITFCC